MQEELLKNEDENIEEYNSITIKAKKIVIEEFRNLCLESNKSQGEMLNFLIDQHNDLNPSSNNYTNHTLYIKKGNSVDKIENVVFNGKKIFNVPFRKQIKHQLTNDEESLGITLEYDFSTEVYLTPKGNYILYIQWTLDEHEKYSSLYFPLKKIDANALVNTIFSMLTGRERNKLYRLLVETKQLDF